MFAPGIISFHVIIPVSFVLNVNGTPVTFTTALPVTTIPLAVRNVNWFWSPAGLITALPEAAAVASIVPKVNGTLRSVSGTTAVPSIVKVPT